MRILNAVPMLLCLAPPAASQTVAPRQPPIIRGWEAAVLVGLTAGAMAIDQRTRHLLVRMSGTLPSLPVRIGNAFGNGRLIMPMMGATAVGGKALGDTVLEKSGLYAFESTVLTAATVLALKSAIGRRRPDVDPHTAFSFRPFAFRGNSFPSGHTAIAFALATSLASETRDHWTDVLLYSTAGLTAFARINEDKHWLSDTVFGAGVGIMAARLIRRWNRDAPTGPAVMAVRFSF